MRCRPANPSRTGPGAGCGRGCRCSVSGASGGAWAGLVAGLLIGWALGGEFVRVFVLVALAMGGLRHWAAGVGERETARPYAAMAAQLCAEPDLHRAWRYGLSYYAGVPLPDCKTNPRRWRAGNSEFGLYLSDTAGK